MSARSLVRSTIRNQQVAGSTPAGGSRICRLFVRVSLQTWRIESRTRVFLVTETLVFETCRARSIKIESKGKFAFDISKIRLGASFRFVVSMRGLS